MNHGFVLIFVALGIVNVGLTTATLIKVYDTSDPPNPPPLERQYNQNSRTNQNTILMESVSNDEQADEATRTLQATLPTDSDRDIYLQVFYSQPTESNHGGHSGHDSRRLNEICTKVCITQYVCVITADNGKIKRRKCSNTGKVCEMKCTTAISFNAFWLKNRFNYGFAYTFDRKSWDPFDV